MMTEKEQALFKTRQERNRVWELVHLNLILRHPRDWALSFFAN